MHSNIYNKNRPEALLDEHRSERRYGERGTLKFRITVLVLLTFAVAACSLLERGYNDHNGQYVPKHPNFKLKDKKGVFPVGLDTINVYKLDNWYGYEGLIYPKTNLTSNEKYSYVSSINDRNFYIKFYSNGRCLKFSIFKLFESEVSSSLRIEDLDPNNEGNSKNYYFSPDGKNIQVESFVWGDGQGHYVMSNYVLSDSGDTLTHVGKYFKRIYKREQIPLSWNRYYVDW